MQGGGPGLRNRRRLYKEKKVNALFEKLLEEIPSYEHFLTAEELDENSRKLAEKYPDAVSLSVIGKSRAGKDLLCLKIGDEPKTALMFGLPHPNEPIGTMMLEYLTERLAADEELRHAFGYTLYAVKAWDYDGYERNEGWIKGPYTLTNYSRNFYRPIGKQQVDWTFPVDYKELHFHDVMPEAEAMMKLIDAIRPDFIYSLHNAGFGGVYWYLTKDLDKNLYESLYEAPRKQEIPIHFGEPESPALQVFYPAVFESGGICQEYDYLEKYGVKDIASEIDCGTCSDEYAHQLCGSITFLTEMPYFYDARIADRSESDITRGEAIKTRIAWTKESNRKLKEALALSEDCLGNDNPFRDSVVCFMKTGSDEAELRMADEDPAYQNKATVAEKFDSIQCSKFYRLLSYGMLVRANELALSRLTEATPENGIRRAKLQKGLARSAELHAALSEELEEEMQYSVIPIRKLVNVQLECGLKVAEYLKTYRK